MVTPFETAKVPVFVGIHICTCVYIYSAFEQHVVTGYAIVMFLSGNWVSVSSPHTNCRVVPINL